MKKEVNNAVIWAWLLWAWAYAYHKAPEAVEKTVDIVAGTGLWIFETTKSLVNNILQYDNGSFAATYAPFAVPMLGWYIWYKIADLMEIENKQLKFSASVWWVISWTMVGSLFIPYLPHLLTAWVLYGWYRLAKGTYNYLKDKNNNTTPSS